MNQINKMKKLVTLMVLMLGLQITRVQNLNAQKIYATKTGQIFFNATGGAVPIAAVNNQVDSKFVETTGQIIFGVLIKGFKFENQLMEDHFNENYMESTQFPKADFKGYIKNSKEVNFTKDGTYPITIEGSLTIHGRSQNVATTGTIQVKEGKPAIVGEFSIKIKDYDIKGLYIGEKIANETKIKVNCKYQN